MGLQLHLQLVGTQLVTPQANRSLEYPFPLSHFQAAGTTTVAILRLKTWGQKERQEKPFMRFVFKRSMYFFCVTWERYLYYTQRIHVLHYIPGYLPT